MKGSEDLEAAVAVMQRAYAPFSRFRVGAVLRDRDGGLHGGCNVENPAYPAGICAERGALAVAVASGSRDFVSLTIATEATVPTPPCGLCRQALVEFSPGLEILSVTTSGQQARWTLRELLPSPFTTASLEHQ
ncbi:MAG: cytidine deaminase [Gemmatimonadota bacterium]